MPISPYISASFNVWLMLLRNRLGSSRVDCHSWVMCICTCFKYRSNFWSVVVFDDKRDRFSGDEYMKVRSMGTRYKVFSSLSADGLKTSVWVDKSGWDACEISCSGVGPPNGCDKV